MLNVAAVFLVGVGSGLVLTLAGVFKDILLITGSVLIFGSYISPLQVIGKFWPLNALSREFSYICSIQVTLSLSAVLFSSGPQAASNRIVETTVAYINTQPIVYDSH